MGLRNWWRGPLWSANRWDSTGAWPITVRRGRVLGMGYDDAGVVEMAYRDGQAGVTADDCNADRVRRGVVRRGSTTCLSGLQAPSA
jgi:hypothetical protein